MARATASGSTLGDRDRVLQRSWSEVALDLPNGVSGIVVKLSASFWRDCPELRSAEIGRWLIAAGHRRWPRGNPPVFTLTQVGCNRFKVG